MIIKRIRIGPKQKRSGRMIGVSAIALVGYVSDARVESLQAVAALTGYITDASHPERNAGDGEKVREVGARNLAGVAIADWQADMAACAMQSTNADPMEHIVVSWRESEVPTPAQVEAAIDTILDELGAGDLQSVFGVHHNTRFVHVHIVINRVCPKTHRLRQLGEGWDIDRLHQAVAYVEAAQGWQTETDGVYAVHPDGELRRRDNGHIAPRKGRGHAGERAERRLTKQAAPEIAELRKAIAVAGTWPELHAALAALNARYDQKGSGAVVSRSGKPPLKASQVSAECSRSALERRLGPFVASADKPIIDTTRLQAQRRIDLQLAAVAEARATTMRLFEAQRDETIADIKQRLGRTTAADALATAIAKEAKSASTAAADSFRAEEQRLRVLRRHAREAADLEASSMLPILFLSDQPERSAAGIVVAGYTARRINEGIAYLDRDGAVAFTDCRTYLRATASATDADLVAVMRLGELRFGTITLTGSASLCARAATLAKVHGISHVPIGPTTLDTAVEPISPLADERSAKAAATSLDYHGWFAIADDQFHALREAKLPARSLNYRSDLKIFQLVSKNQTPAAFEQLVRFLALLLTKPAQLSAEATLATERDALAAKQRRQYEEVLAVRAKATRDLGIKKAKRVAAQRAAERAAAEERAAATERTAAERSSNWAPNAGLPAPSRRRAPTVQEDDFRRRKRDQSYER